MVGYCGLEIRGLFVKRIEVSGTTMLKIFNEKFAQWTEGKTLAQARVSIYEKVRDIPYAVVPDLNDVMRYGEILKYGRGSCTPKHLLLGNKYERLGLLILYSVFPFRWDHAKFDYPSRLKRLAKKLPPAYHLACRVDIDGELILVDATLDLALGKLGLPVNRSWDGISNTLLPIIPEGDEQLYHPSEAYLIQKRYPDENSMKFYNELNHLLEEGRLL
jgi:hypothetical protein